MISQVSKQLPEGAREVLRKVLETHTVFKGPGGITLLRSKYSFSYYTPEEVREVFGSYYESSIWPLFMRMLRAGPEVKVLETLPMRAFASAPPLVRIRQANASGWRLRGSETGPPLYRQREVVGLPIRSLIDTNLWHESIDFPRHVAWKEIVGVVGLNEYVFRTETTLLHLLVVCPPGAQRIVTVLARTVTGEMACGSFHMQRNLIDGAVRFEPEPFYRRPNHMIVVDHKGKPRVLVIPEK